MKNQSHSSWVAGGQARSFPNFKRLTYRRGFISNARFAPDGQTILYSTDWDGAPSRIFSTRPGVANPLPCPCRARCFSPFRPAAKWLVDQQDWTRGLLSGQKAEARLVSRTDLRMADFSDDGSLLVLREAHLEGTPSVWVARADDSPPIRLGEGVAHGLSPDERGCSRASRASSWLSRRPNEILAPLCADSSP